MKMIAALIGLIVLVWIGLDFGIKAAAMTFLFGIAVDFAHWSK